MSIKSTYFKTLSLCVVAGLTATLVTFSQTGDTPVTPFNKEAAATAPATIPIARTITDTKGRAMEGTVTSKSATGITFQRDSDKKIFEIKLDTLSTDDIAFIASLAEPDPLAALAPKKTSVLFMVQYGYKYPEYVERLNSLRQNSGFEVTLAMPIDPDYRLDSHMQMGEVPATEKVTLITDPAMVDGYDVLWIPQFHTPRQGKGYKVKGPSFFDITNHRNTSNKTVVVAVGNKGAARKKIYSDTGNATRMIEIDNNFVGTDENWIFYSRNLEERGEEKLFDKISEELARLKMK
jgi:hypothetical protein